TKTQPLTVKVVSVLDAQASEIKPLKPQLEMSDPANVLFIVGMIVLGLLVIGAMAAAIIYYRRSMPPPALATAAAALDAATIALRELERIARLGLLEQGRDGEYYVLVADTLRTYIVQRYRIPALERTTYEVQSVLGRAA